MIGGSFRRFIRNSVGGAGGGRRHQLEGGKLAFLLAGCLLFSGCNWLPLTAKDTPEVPRPEAIMDFPTLFQQNCAGCHGTKGIDGPAYPLANPEYQALVDEETLRQVVTHGLPGTLMPAFAVSQGGALTDRQVEALVDGMRTAWWKRTLVAGHAPPYHPVLTGDAVRGHTVYSTSCAACHGEPGHPEEGFAGSIADANYLSLMSDQALRTVIIAGRPDIGMPDWKGDFPGGNSGHSKMSDQQVTDVVAWFSSLRVPAIQNHVSAAPGQSSSTKSRNRPSMAPAAGQGGFE